MQQGRASALVTATWLLLVGQVSGCWGGCRPHVWDGPPLTANQQGEPTPREALHAWINGAGGGPDEGWRRDRDASSDNAVVYVSGEWHLTVSRAPAGASSPSGGCG